MIQLTINNCYYNNFQTIKHHLLILFEALRVYLHLNLFLNFSILKFHSLDIQLFSILFLLKVIHPKIILNYYKANKGLIVDAKTFVKLYLLDISQMKASLFVQCLCFVKFHRLLSGIGLIFLKIEILLGLKVYFNFIIELLFVERSYSNTYLKKSI